MAISLNSLRPAKAQLTKKRVGRGPGSELGKTAGRGEKDKSLAQVFPQVGFEEAMPLHRRYPSAGFTNIFKNSGWK
jgi:large subunit ribosomal protein L15